MKKLFLFLAMASTTMFVSCGSDDSDSTPAATSITLAASSTTVTLGQTVNLTVTDNLGANVTTTSTFFNGSTAITAAFTPTAPGTYTLTAKNGTLTSAAITVTVAVAQNTVVANGASAVADKSILYYLGSTEAGINVFVANAYNEVGETYPNDIYVYLTVAQDTASEFLTIPTVGDYTFGDVTAGMKVFDANVIINSQEILETEITTDASLNLSSIVATETAQNWAFTYAIKLANNSYVYGSFSGDFGFSDESARPAARGSQLKVVKVSNEELLSSFKAVVAKNKK